MGQRKTWWINAVLLFVCIAINYFSVSTLRVEKLYSTSFYVQFASILRKLVGWLPFSIGDLLYGAVIVFLFVKLVKFIKFLFGNKKNFSFKEKLTTSLSYAFRVFAIVYIIFNVFWGINYNREGIAAQLNLKIDKYSIDDLKNINAILVEKINVCKTSLINVKTEYPSSKILFEKTAVAYSMVEKKYPYLHYKNISIKKSMWGWAGNYIGFEGYYNPFTGEAQINTTVPKFTQPFTACHEVAHQLGYAKEMEANFVGYLAATASTDTLFKYAVYVEMFSYANRTLFIADSTAAIQLKKTLLPAVINDFKERRKFYEAHRSFVEPIVSYLYGKFLESNEQPMGILSYDEVTAFIIAYYKKYGNI
jgi:Protein of unknown function (DUF3810)